MCVLKPLGPIPRSSVLQETLPELRSRALHAYSVHNTSLDGFTAVYSYAHLLLISSSPAGILAYIIRLFLAAIITGYVVGLPPAVGHRTRFASLKAMHCGLPSLAIFMTICLKLATNRCWRASSARSAVVTRSPSVAGKLTAASLVRQDKVAALALAETDAHADCTPFASCTTCLATHSPCVR